MIAIYCRVSSAKQTKEETIQNQVEYATKFCDLNNITPTFYLDDGVTGTIPLTARPNGSKLMQDAEAGLIDTLYIYKIDRLGRSTKVILDAINQLEKYNVTVKSMTEPFDTSSPAGRFMLTMLAGVANLERDNIVERMRLGRNKATRNNRYTFGLPPYGYRLNKDATLRIEEAEAKVVRRIYDLYLTGNYSWLDIAKILNVENIPLPQNCLSSKYNRWRLNTVGVIIKSTAYTGQYETKCGTISTPAIVTQEEYDKAQEIVKKNIKFSPRAAHRVYLLTSLCRCAKCGYMYGGRSTLGSRAVTPMSYYVCSNRYYYKQRSGIQCRNKNWRAEKLDEYVWNECVSYLKDDITPVAIKRAENIQTLDPESISKAIKECDVEKERILDVYRIGIMPLADLQTQIEKIDKKKSALEADLQKLKNMAPSRINSDIKKQLLTLIDTSNLDILQKRDILRTLIDTVIIDDDNIRIIFNC